MFFFLLLLLRGNHNKMPRRIQRCGFSSGFGCEQSDMMLPNPLIIMIKSHQRD